MTATRKVERSGRKARAIGGLPAAILILAAAPSFARAADQGVIFAGGILDNASYGSIGLQLALPGARNGKGFAIRGSAFYGGYQYSGGQGQGINATFDGGNLEGVYQWSGAWGYANAFAGAQNMDTRLRPTDAGNPRLGDQTEPVFGSDGARMWGPWRSDWYGSYGARFEDYQTRVSLTHQVGSLWRLGAEVGFEGDRTYSLERAGPYVAVSLSPRSEAQMSVGYSHQDGRGGRGYARIGWYRSF